MDRLQLANFTHGGDIYTEGLLKGRELIDFSSNINPLGLPESFLEHMEEAVRAVTRYPDIKYRELLRSLVEYIDISYIGDKNIVQGNGAAEIIDLVISCHRRILIAVPSFVEYEEDAVKWNCSIEYSYLKEDMTYDYEDMLFKLKGTDALILGNPNNPNGNIIDKNKFIKILDYCEENSKTVIIDEAFIEFTGNRELSFLQEAEKYSCIFIIRALTKFFGMPGLRFGYGISMNEDLVEAVRKKLNPWNINCFAEVAVKYVLKDEEYIRRSLKWIEGEGESFPAKLSELELFDRVYPTRCNYVLCRLKEMKGEELYRYCMERRIAIRRASNFRGLDDRFIRLAVKDRISNDILIQILNEIQYLKLGDRL